MSYEPKEKKISLKELGASLCKFLQGLTFSVCPVWRWCTLMVSSNSPHFSSNFSFYTQLPVHFGKMVYNYSVSFLKSLLHPRWYLCQMSGLGRQYLSGISFSLVYISNLFFKNHSILIEFIINHKQQSCV